MADKSGAVDEGLSTLSAYTGLLPSVDPLVLVEVWLVVEDLPTLEALVGLLPGMDDGVLNESEHRSLSHTCLSLVWICWCVVSCDLWWKTFLYSMHSKGFSPVWMM